MITKEAISRFQETKRHGSALFPFNIYPCTIPGDFPSVSLHWHKSMELIFIKKGCGTVQLCMQPMAAKKDDIFVVPPGTLHAIRERSGFSMDYENVIFDVDFLGGAAADICAQEYLVPLSAGRLLHPMCLRPPAPAEEGALRPAPDAGRPGEPDVLVPELGEALYSDLAACLTRAERLCRGRRRGYELGVKASILELLSLLVPLCPGVSHEDSAYTERLKFVLSRVEEDYAHPVSVQKMAVACGCSASHFMRWFRQMTGTSFGAYQAERRLAYAAEQLRQTSDKVISVAIRSGFDNLSNFNRQFKSRYGVTPSVYRSGGDTFT